MPIEEVNFQIPKKLERIITTKKRIVVLYGGRGSGKSEGAGRVMIMKADTEGADILCGREFQTSIDDSVHKLLKSLLIKMGVEAFPTDKKIDFPGRGGFRYKGFARNSSAVRSAQGFKYSWIEEAQYLSQESIDDLLPTIREGDSQLFFTANLMASNDPFSKRFIAPFKAQLDRDGFYEDEMHLIINVNWRDNPWFPKELELERQWDFDNRPRAEYDHIWEGHYNDTVEGSIIRAEWFDACVDAHIKLGFKPEGFKIVSHDPSDTGPNPKGLVYRHGSVILDVQEKTDGDVNEGCSWALDYAIQVGADMFVWDCDGMGIALTQQVTRALDGKKIFTRLFKGSESPEKPDQKYQSKENIHSVSGKTNKETFKNKRAQNYWRVRDRMHSTYRAVVKKEYIDPDEMISISSEINCLAQFRSEICRIPRKVNPNGFLQIKTKDEMKRLGIESPNLADSAMMAMEIPEPIVKEIKSRPPLPLNRIRNGWGANQGRFSSRQQGHFTGPPPSKGPKFW